MRIPRDIKGRELAKLVQKQYGYVQTRQTGSHMRMTSEQNGTHHITIPDHNPVKLGTLKGIINDIAEHNNIDSTEVIKTLFS